MKRKELTVNADFDVNRGDRIFDKRDFDDMMKYAASIGATRFEWGFDPFWKYYTEHPCGFDLLAELVTAAHRHGLRFYTTFKPFEAAGTARWQGGVVPPTLPRPKDVPWIEDINGIIQATRPFTAAHPEMRMARRPGDGEDPGGRITSIRLIKSDDGPLRFDPKDISIWTSPRNGGFERLTEEFSWNEKVEWRPAFPPGDRMFRILSLEGLDLSEDSRYILLRCEKTDEKGTFYNDIDHLVELVNEHGVVVPSTPSSTRVKPESAADSIGLVTRLNKGAYVMHPEVRELLLDREKMISLYRDMFDFNYVTKDITLDLDGEVAVVRGKRRYVTGVLCPAYTEVRRHWLEQVQFCIDRGVDGVNIRIANHNRPREPWAYGFNEPVLKQMTNPMNTAEAARINGNAYTQFLREAADLLHGSGKEMGVHINGGVFKPDDRNCLNGPVPSNIEWQWETWLREIVDFVELRGVSALRPENQREVVDRIGLVTREAKKEFILQSTRSNASVHFDGPHPTLAREMAWARAHPDINGYNLYESWGFLRINQEGRIEGSADIAKLIKEHWFE